MKVYTALTHMKKPRTINDKEFNKKIQELREKASGKRTLGFYIQVLFMVGALFTVVKYGAWNVLWVLFAYFPLTIIAIAKTFFWTWTETRLRKDAEAGRMARAVLWDYLTLLVDWLFGFCAFTIFTFAVFALADGCTMTRPLVWLCVAGTYTTPIVFNRKDPGYHWGNFSAWEQWAVAAIVTTSGFLPIGPLAGVAIQAAVALISIPLAWHWKRPSIANKAANYRNNALTASASHSEPPPQPSQSPAVDLAKMLSASIRVQWIPFIATVIALVAGVVWTLCLRLPIAILFALLAIALGYVAQLLIACPMFTPQDEIAKRRLDVDLVRNFAKFRVVLTDRKSVV